MAKNAPEVTIKNDGTRIIEPDFRLKEKIGDNIATIISPEKLKQAEKVIEQGKGHFGEEMLKEIAALEKLFSGYTESRDMNSVNYKSFIDRILNMKSSSAMYEFPLATEIARSLFEYAHKRQEHSAKDVQILKVHLNALKAVFVRNIRDMGGDLERQLLRELRLLSGIEG